MIDYTDTTTGITPAQLGGFFVGWPDPPSPETHLKILKNAFRIVLALDTEAGKVIGFINAIGDGVLSAYIPLLEVLPEYQGRGIGSELVRRLLRSLDGLYMIDLLCDRDLQPFYERVGMRPMTAMMVRNLDAQSGK